VARQHCAAYEEVRWQFRSGGLRAVYRQREFVLVPDDEELWSFLLRHDCAEERLALRTVVRLWVVPDSVGLP
jgi:hypothetical protein